MDCVGGSCMIRDAGRGCVSMMGSGVGEVESGIGRENDGEPGVGVRRASAREEGAGRST